MLRPVENQFYGDRAGSMIDPFGHQWHIATHIEDIPPDEMMKRARTRVETAEKREHVEHDPEKMT